MTAKKSTKTGKNFRGNFFWLARIYTPDVNNNRYTENSPGVQKHGADHGTEKKMALYSS